MREQSRINVILLAIFAVNTVTDLLNHTEQKAAADPVIVRQPFILCTLTYTFIIFILCFFLSVFQYVDRRTQISMLKHMLVLTVCVDSSVCCTVCVCVRRERGLRSLSPRLGCFSYRNSLQQKDGWHLKGRKSVGEKPTVPEYPRLLQWVK